MKNQFEEAFFNEKEYLVRKNELEELAGRVTACVSKLKGEGLPITSEFIAEITANDMAFRNHIRNLADK